MKKGKLNAIEPVKKRKVKWPREEEELCALNAELKDFNHKTSTTWISKESPTRKRKMERSISPCRMKFPMKSLSEWHVRIRKEA